MSRQTSKLAYLNRFVAGTAFLSAFVWGGQASAGATISPSPLLNSATSGPISYATGTFTLQQGAQVALGSVTLTLKNDGNLAVSQGINLLWSTGIEGVKCDPNSCKAVFETGGDLKIYNGTHTIWTTGTDGFPGATLSLSPAAPFVEILTSNNSILWASSYRFPALTIPQNASISLGSVSLTMQSDGNLVLRQGATPLWSTNTSVGGCKDLDCQATFQPDGNFVVTQGSTQLWNSDTGGNTGAQLVLAPTAPYLRIEDVYGLMLAQVDLSANGQGKMIGRKIATVQITPSPLMPISPLLFGTNYDWNMIDIQEFPSFNSMMNTIGVTMMRYPGGWNGENYNWSNNAETDWAHYSGGPVGVDADSFLNDIIVPADFILPSEAAVADPAQIPSVVTEAERLVKRYGSSVQVWEIGNEWWNQGPAHKSAKNMESNFKHYAALVATEAPALKRANPSITLYATLDWTQPDDFSQFATLVGPVGMAALDGISIHSYCGTDPTLELCSSLPQVVSQIEAATGKTKVFASEWAANRTDTVANQEAFGLPNANVVALAIQDMANAGMTAATYWPPSAKEIAAISFASAKYKTQSFDGTLFSWMAKYYTGSTLATSGYQNAIASTAIDGSVTLFIPSMGSGKMTVVVPLAGTGLTHVVSAEVLYSTDPEDPSSLASQFATLPTQISTSSAGSTGSGSSGASAVSFVLNPGTEGRGSNWEIARVTLSAE